MKTIFITAYHPFVSRNIFNTDVLKEIKKQNDIKVVIFTLPLKKQFMEKYYGGANVAVEELDLEPVIRSKYNKFWHRLGFLLQNTYYMQDRRKSQFYDNNNILGWLNYRWVDFWARTLSGSKLVRGMYRFLDYIFSPKHYFDDFVIRYKPDIFFSTDAFSEHDALFAHSAKKYRIPLIGMVRSWDNTTTKGILRVVPRGMIVNSRVLKEELVEMHDLDDAKIEVVGLPQFDKWLEGPTISRKEFLAKVGADSSKKLILFAPAGAILSDTDWQICRMLKDAMDNGLLPGDIQFLVRNHPHHPADFSMFNGDSRFIIENPGSGAGRGHKSGAELSPDDNSHLMHSVYYSDVVMYIATSLGLDSTVFDKPQIIVSFDGWEERPYVKSVKRYHNEDNIRKLIETEGTKVAENKEELIKFINMYLENPSIDREGRRKIVDWHMHKIDGQAGKRVAYFIIKFLNRSKI